MDLIRPTHPYSFRSGEWARIVTQVTLSERTCYLVEYRDGVTHWLPVVDEQARYDYWKSEQEWTQ